MPISKLGIVLFALLLLYPCSASEKTIIHSAWNAGYLEKPVILRTTITPTVYKSVGNGSCVDFVKYNLDRIGEVWHTPMWVWKNFANFGLKKADLNVEYSRYETTIIVTNESQSWHMGLITDFDGNNISIIEQNFHGIGIVSNRTLNINDERIVGFLKE